MPLFRKTEIPSPMYEVAGQDGMKSEIMPHLPVSKRGYNLKRVWAEVIQRSLNK